MAVGDGAAELRRWQDGPIANMGVLTGEGTFTATAHGPRYGDLVQMSVRLDEHGRVSAANFKAHAPRSIGCAAFLCDWAKGKTLAELGACATLELGERFEIERWYWPQAAVAGNALLALVKEAKLARGEMLPEEAEIEAAAQLTLTPELFDEVAFAEQIERVADKLAKAPSLDWARVGLRVAAAVMGHEPQALNPQELDPTTRTAAEILADIRYLDGGLTQDVAGRAMAVLAARASKGGA